MTKVNLNEVSWTPLDNHGLVYGLVLDSMQLHLGHGQWRSVASGLIWDKYCPVAALVQHGGKMAQSSLLGENIEM